MAFLYPSCPVCRSDKVDSIESDSIEYANRHMKQIAGGHATGAAHPILGYVATAITIGRFVWKRLPSIGGAKKCGACGHQFV